MGDLEHRPALQECRPEAQQYSTDWRRITTETVSTVFTEAYLAATVNRSRWQFPAAAGVVEN